MPQVSVVSIFHNRAAFVAPSLRSLLWQTHPDCEIIVVDDGSTDGTWAEIDRFDDPRLVKRRQANRGFTVSIDEAVRSSRGALIAVHGAGDVSLPDRLVRQAELIEHTGAEIVSCWVRTPRLIYRPPGWQSREAMPLWPVVLRANPFSHGEVMYRREAFERSGGYRPFFVFAQDRDLWLRMGPEATYAVVPEVLCERFLQPGSVRSVPAKVVMQKRLSAYAVHCARLRAQEGRDPVDSSNIPVGTLPLLRDWRLSREFLRLAGAAVRSRNLSAAKLYLKAAGQVSFARGIPAPGSLA